MGVIYLRKNLINGMVYVGQTNDFKKRQKAWNCLKFRYANQLLTDDRNKYGLDNFETIILKECDDSELDRWEKHCIKILNTIYPNGYNINEGGSIGFHHSQRTKDKISKANSGEKNGMYNKKPWNKNRKWSDDVKKKLSKSHVGKPSPMKGKHHTDETKKKISKNKKHASNIKLAKMVIRIENDGKITKYVSVADAQKITHFSHIADACRGEYHSHGHTLKESQWFYEDDYERMKDLNLVLN